MSGDSNFVIINTELQDSSSLKNQLIVLNKYNILTVTDTDIRLTQQLINQAVNSTLLLDVSGLTSFRGLSLGADTAANAKELIDILNIQSLDQSVILSMQIVSNNTTGTLLGFGNSDGTQSHILVDSTSGGVIVNVNAITSNGRIIIRGYAVDLTPGSEVINFDRLKIADT